MTRYALDIRLDNAPGVLARVTGLLARRGFSVDALTFDGTAGRHDTSRLTLVLPGDEDELTRAASQLDRLIDVIEIAVVDAGSAKPAPVTRTCGTFDGRRSV